MSIGDDATDRRRAENAAEGGSFISTGWSRKPPDTLTSEQRPEVGERGAMWLSLGRESQAEGTTSEKALGLEGNGQEARRGEQQDLWTAARTLL